MDTNFPTTLGVEYTVVPENMNVAQSHKLYDLFYDWSWNEGKSLDKIPYSDNVFKYELGAWEICSRKLQNFNQVKSFYDGVRRILREFEKEFKVKLVANTTYKHRITKEEIYCEGGGGHLHLGQPKGKGKKPFNLNYFIEILNHVSLHWVMSEWCDDDILLSTFFHGMEKKWGIKIKELNVDMLNSLIHTYALSDWGQGPIQLRSVPGVAALKYGQKHNTHELRFFGAPIDYDHLVDNINLAMAIWSYTKEDYVYSVPLLRFRSFSEIKDRFDVTDKREIILNEFYELLDILGLDEKRYKRYEKNLDLRLKYGNLWTSRLPA